MIVKKKICAGCKTDQYIYGDKRCLPCYKKKFPEKFQLKKSERKSSKNHNKRKEERKYFPEFFQRHIQKIKDERLCCENCGELLQGLSGEVCHILSKSKHLEVATEDNNIVYLCFYGNSCHSKFDSSLSARKEMPVFKIALERYRQFKHKIVNYTREREQLENYGESC